MRPRQALAFGAVCWGTLGAVVAISAFGQVNEDARLLVGAFTVACPLAAVLAARAMAHHRDRVAGLLLIVSAATPTYFFWPPNVLALLLGLTLIVAPTVLLRDVAPAAG